MPQPRYTQRHLHRGYRYQDLLAALAMAEVLAQGEGSVGVESARFEGDRFDDVVIERPGRAELRIQAKHFQNAAPLRRSLFVGDGQKLDFARLMAGAAGAEGPELRVLSTLPSDQETAAEFLAAEAQAAVSGLSSTRWRLDPFAVWPVENEEAGLPLPEGVDRAGLADFCRRFVIEVDATPMSGVLADPGELELALLALLREEVGVEQYPNRRSAEDVAGRLLEIVASLRGREVRRLDFGAIARESALQIDRGRVAQAFPLDRHRLVGRVPLRVELEQALAVEQRIVVEGPPGSGKSWVLEALAQDLQASGVITARHYCFLAPGDPSVGQRVALEAMSANLVSELAESSPLEGPIGGLGGDLGDLERALGRLDRDLSQSPEHDDRQILLIVDGLDHVSRVDPDPGALPASPSDFADQLALLELPDRVRLIVASQPGAHLEPLQRRGAHTVSAPPFELRHTGGLLARQGVFRAIRESGLEGDHVAALEAIHRQSDGNPLYAGFLGKQVLAGLEAGEALLPSARIAAIEGAAGDLELYYEHLLATVEQAPDDGMVAERLALVDFPLTIGEVDEIFGGFGRERLERIVAHLRPILDDLGTQGGLRIHHESFRRFIFKRLDREGRALVELLDPVIGWLEARGFFADDRAFRYMLVLLGRAGHAQRLLEEVGADFVARALAELQPKAAVSANLALAAATASAQADFPAIVRIAELGAAAWVAYDEKISDPTEWAAGVIDLGGAERLSGRLTFDREPSWPHETGLRLCSLIDRSGGDPPWRAYLDLKRDTSSAVRSAEEDERYALDHLRGSMRLLGDADSIEMVAARLNERPRFSGSLLEGSARLCGEVLGVEGLEAILAAGGEATDAARGWFELALAELLDAEGRGEEVIAAAERSAGLAAPPRAIRRLLDLGLPASSIEGRAELIEAAEAARAERLPEAGPVDGFFAAALLAGSAGEDLAACREALAGEGFYRAWLRFCCDLAEATREGGGILEPLEELCQHVDPFLGQPRACDLYSIHDLCHESFRRAAALIAGAEWSRAWGLLLEISSRTTTSLDRSPSGPLTIWALIEIALPYARMIPLGSVREELVENLGNQYYDYHAESALALARFEMEAGEAGRGEERMAEVATFYSAYGFRKDTTVFGLVEALEVLGGEEEREAVSERLERARALCHRAYIHTDGRETSHATDAWFAAFAAHAPGAAAELLARTLLEDKPVEYHVNESAFDAAMSAGAGLLSPLLAHLLYRAKPAADPKGWLASIEALAAEDEGRAREAFAETAAAVEGDAERPSPELAEICLEFAGRMGWPAPEMNATPDRRPGGGNGGAPPREEGERETRGGPYLGEGESMLDLLVALRSSELDDRDRPVVVEDFTEELLERLRPFLEGDPEGVAELLEAFAQAQRFWDQATEILGAVGEAIAEDSPGLAARVLALAWTAARSGWEPFGGMSRGGLLRRAAELSPPAALAQLIGAFCEQIQAGHSYGLTRRAAEALALLDRPQEALAVWDQSFEVIARRLPQTGPERPPFGATGPDLDPKQTQGAFAALLGATLHCPDFERRAASLAGIAELFGADPILARRALEPLFERDAAFTDTLLAVRLLELTEDLEVARGLPDPLWALAQGSALGLRESARALLGRLGAEVPGAELAERVEPIEDEGRVGEALTWDTRERIERMTESWPPAAGVVAARYWSLFNADSRATRRVIEEQAETQFSRTEQWVPPWPIHRWESELFEVALHDSGEQLLDALAERGATPEAMHDLLAADVGAAVSRARSRVLRPPGLSLPDDREDGDGAPRFREGGEFAGWLRVALCEYELRQEERTGHATFVRSGLRAGGGEEQASPLAGALIDSRWHRQSSEAGAPEDRLAVIWRDHHLVAWEEMISLSPRLIEEFGLHPAPQPAPFDLLDEGGERAAVLRRWRMRPFSYDYRPRAPMIRGSELLLRPDLAVRLEGRDLTEVTRVSRT